MSSWTVVQWGPGEVPSRCEGLTLCDVQRNRSPAFSLEGFGSQVRPHRRHAENRMFSANGGEQLHVRDSQSWQSPTWLAESHCFLFA